MITESESLRLIGFSKSASSYDSRRDANIEKGLAYKAPESFKNKQETYADMWSVGVLLYRLVYGKLPFDSKDDLVLKECIKLGKYQQGGDDFKDVSKECKDFIR